MTNKKKYEVAVILINYNSSNYSIKCIESIIDKTSEKLHYQIIIIDNGSENSDFKILKNYVELNPVVNIELIRNDINTGFGAGNMLGVHYSNANYLAFINNDSLLTNDCLSIIIDSMKVNNFGICGPLCFKEDGSLLPTIDHFASPAKEFFGRKILEKFNPERFPNRKKIYTEPQKAQFVSGSFMLIKKDDFNEVGGFDTNIFLYYEETDLCIRLQKINKFAYLIPDAQFIHYHGGSTPSNINIKIELKISYLYVIFKHYGYFWHKVILIKLQIQYFCKSIFKPHYWSIFKIMIIGAPLSKSLKMKQKLNS